MVIVRSTTYNLIAFIIPSFSVKKNINQNKLEVEEVQGCNKKLIKRRNTFCNFANIVIKMDISKSVDVNLIITK